LSSQSTAEQYDKQEINKLSKLSEINSDLNAYSVYYEAKLSLARFLSTNDQLEDARAVLKPFIQKALEQARKPDNAQDSDEDDSTGRPDEDEKDSDNHTRGIALFCDGDCGRSWDYADDIWVCRDCLCVQLDTGCLEKLRRIELPITICNPKHEHLHVLSFDKHAWKGISSADLIVGSEVMSRDAWLSMLEQEWCIEK
jgi:hypothetical protein